MMAIALVDLTSLSEATLAVLGDAVLKATIVLLIAAVASLALRRASSAARHMVWLVAVVGTLALPALALALPALRIPVPLDRPASAVRQPVPTQAAPVVLVPLALSAEAYEPAPDPGPPALPWQAVVLAIWIVGAGSVLVRARVAGSRVRAIVAGARPVDGDVWTVALARAAARLGLPESLLARVRLVSSPLVAAPATWGVREPAILLPDAANDWPVARREAVLLHELAHVRRRDCATQLAADVACAVYWFNPVAWLAAGALRAEREHAADDCVLGAGVRASEYASLLVDVASATPHPLGAPAASFASARRSHLERRIRSILDPDRPRRPVGRAAAFGAMALATLVVAPLAASRAASPPVDPAEVREIANPAPARTSAGVPVAGPASASQPAVARERSPRPADPQSASTTPPTRDEETPEPWPVPTPTPTPPPPPSPGGDGDDDAAVDPAAAAPAPDDTEVVTALKMALTDDDAGVRQQAAWALRMIRIRNGEIPTPHPRPRPRPRITTTVRPRVVVEEPFPAGQGSDN